MHHVAVVGAGELGGAVAHALARCDVARKITIIDERGRADAGKALDIAQAAPVEGFSTMLIGAADLSFTVGADLVVVADRFDGGDEDALALMARLSTAARRGVLLFAGAHACGAIDRGVAELKLPRTRVIGSAPEALAGGARALVALAAGASPRDVALTVLGIPPAGTVIPWADAAVGGFALTGILDEPTRRRLDAQIRALWPPGPFALAGAAAKVAAAIDGRSRQLASCFVAPDVSAGARARTAALPVRLGPAGVAEVVLPALSGGERVALENAMQL